MNPAFSLGREVILRNQGTLLKIAHDELGRSTQDLQIEWSWLESYLDHFSNKEVPLWGVPRGKTVVLGSWVWPLFYSTQFIFANLRAGNSVVIKPSPFSSKTVGALVTCLHEAAPLFLSVQCEMGDQEKGRQLANQADVKTIIFQGSYESGLRVAQEALPHLWKQPLLYLGAKNPAVVFEDQADPPDALIRDCFIDSAQNCMSTAIIFVSDTRMNSFQKSFIERAREVPFSRMIDPAMGDRYLKMIAVAEREGAKILLRGAASPLSATVASLPPWSAQQLQRSTLLHVEVMAPLVVLIPYTSLEHLRELLGALFYGHTLSLWGSASGFLQRYSGELIFGRVVSNQSVFLPHAWKSFNGKKRSGNHGMLGKGLLSQLMTAPSID